MKYWRRTPRKLHNPNSDSLSLLETMVINIMPVKTLIKLEMKLTRPTYLRRILLPFIPKPLRKLIIIIIS